LSITPERPQRRDRRARMPTTSAQTKRRSLLGIGRVGVAVISVLALAITGACWWATRHLVGGITVSQALGLDAPHSTDGSMNILLIGLDSRKDQHGDDLPQQLLDQLHAGGSDDGGYYLIGLKRLHQRLFEQIDWSTERVFEQTLERAREIGLEAELERLRAVQQAREKDRVALEHDMRKLADDLARTNSRLSVARLELERLRRDAEKSRSVVQEIAASGGAGALRGGT